MSRGGSGRGIILATNHDRCSAEVGPGSLGEGIHGLPLGNPCRPLFQLRVDRLVSNEEKLGPSHLALAVGRLDQPPGLPCRAENGRLEDLYLCCSRLTGRDGGGALCADDERAIQPRRCCRAPARSAWSPFTQLTPRDGRIQAGCRERRIRLERGGARGRDGEAQGIAYRKSRILCSGGGRCAANGQPRGFQSL